MGLREPSDYHHCILWHGHLGRVFTGWKPVPQLDARKTRLEKIISDGSICQHCILVACRDEPLARRADIQVSS